MGNGSINLGTTGVEASGTAHVGAGSPHTASYLEGPLNRLNIEYRRPEGIFTPNLTTVGIRTGFLGDGSSSGFSLDLGIKPISDFLGEGIMPTHQGTLYQFDLSTAAYLTGGWLRYANGASQGTADSTRTVTATDPSYPTPEQEASGDQALDPANNGIPAGEVTANPEDSTSARTYEEVVPGSHRAVDLHVAQLGAGETFRVAWHPNDSWFVLFAQASVSAGLSVPVSPDPALGGYLDGRVLFGLTFSLDPDSYKSSAAAPAAPAAAAPVAPAAPAAPAAPTTGGAPSTGAP